MTNEQSKAHWWIVENHPNLRIESPKKYFEICDIIHDALNQEQNLAKQIVIKCDSVDSIPIVVTSADEDDEEQNYIDRF